MTELMYGDAVSTPCTLRDWVVHLAADSAGGRSHLRLLGGHAATLDFVHQDSYSVAFDGTLYNSLVLGRQLDLPHDVSDAAIVLHGYRRWGDDVLQRIRGIYTVIIWDGERRQLLATHDPLGVYPLFYCDAGSDLILSMSIDALVGSPGASRALNVAALADHLCFRYPIPEETYYSDVKRVVPGYALRVTERGRTSFLSWNPDLGDHAERLDPTDIERFDALLDQAVLRCLRQGAAGIALSGGIDSPTVAMAAAEISNREGFPPPIAVSMMLPNARGGEEAIVQKGVAAGLGLPHVLYPFDPIGSRDSLLEALELAGTLQSPGSSPWNAAHRQLALRARDRGCQILLTGNGGDEWMGVNGEYAAQVIRSGNLLAFIRLCKSMEYSFRGSRWQTVRGMTWKYGARILLRDAARNAALKLAPAQVHARWRRIANDEIPTWVAPNNVVRRQILERAYAQLPTGKGFRDGWSAVRASLDNPVVSMEMEELFENGEQAGVTQLHPLMDIDFVEFCLRAPASLLNYGGRTKGLARRRLTQRFPGLGFDEQRKGSFAPVFSAWTREQGHAAWRAYGGTPALAELGIVDLAKLEKDVFGLLSDNRHTPASLFYYILSTEAWVRAHSK